MTKIQTVLDLFKLSPQKGDVGIEIEISGKNLPSSANPYWNVVGDGSLRGEETAEYVLQQPVNMWEVPSALASLDEIFAQHNTSVKDSVYAGLHVHINVQKLTAKNVYTYITAALVLEPLLLSMCGKSRKGNHFCLGAKEAEYQIQHLIKTTCNQRLENMYSSDLRYAALNVTSLRRFGSLEFRAMKSTVDWGLISDWANILLHIRNESIKFDSPLEVVREFSSMSHIEMSKLLIGERLFDKYFKNIWGSEEVELNIQGVQSLAFIPDWDSFK